MKISILTDNTEYREFKAEWGLSIYVEYEGRPAGNAFMNADASSKSNADSNAPRRDSDGQGATGQGCLTENYEGSQQKNGCGQGVTRVLLDTGATGLFAENAALMGIDLNTVDFTVLSHAHWDHANGYETFFALNDHAPLYLQDGTAENCYTNQDGEMEYCGIFEGCLEQYRDRIRYVNGKYMAAPGIWLLSHTAPGLDEVGRKAHMFIRAGSQFVPDSFRHEQSLIFETARGLVIMNSCSHAGADTIIREAAAAFPGQKLYAMIGGFHLYSTPEQEVRAFALRVRDTGIEHVITGHCSGEEGMRILKEELGDMVVQMHSGLVMEL